MKYKLLDDAFSKSDIAKGVKVLKSKQITMSKETKNFAKKIGAKFALMVNSGFSANLIALFSSINPLQKNYLKKGDEVIIPAICWSTSLWSIIQAGLKPIFVDLDTLNMSIKDLEKNILIGDNSKIIKIGYMYIDNVNKILRNYIKTNNARK